MAAVAGSCCLKASVLDMKQIQQNVGQREEFLKKLLFLDVSMLSAFVAVSSTLFRFILNFWEKHPTGPERDTIDYEANSKRK